MLISVSGSSQDAREKYFGPLFDGAKNSHNELIAKGWVYLFDARVPSEGQAVKGIPLAYGDRVGPMQITAGCWEKIIRKTRSEL